MNNYRYEIKFVLDESSYSDALQWLYVCTNAVNRYPDRYINTIYLDNPDYESVRDNLAGISDRLKIRIRWYDGDPVVKLEKKIRNPGIWKIVGAVLRGGLTLGHSDLKTAMKMIAKTQKGPDEQIPSMGCNIKWFN